MAQEPDALARLSVACTAMTSTPPTIPKRSHDSRIWLWMYSGPGASTTSPGR